MGYNYLYGYNYLFMPKFMMTSSNGNIFRVTGYLCGEFAGHRWIPLTKASDAEIWYFRWYALWINGWVNNRGTGDLRRHRTHYDVIVMFKRCSSKSMYMKQALVKKMIDISWSFKQRQTRKFNTSKLLVYSSSHVSMHQVIVGAEQIVLSPFGN